MSITAVILALAAAADPAITVTGHAWAPFISPMGEPFRARSAADNTMARWFVQADLNRDEILTVEEMQRLLAKYGYGVNATGYLDGATRDAVAAFQRHFRPERIDGVIDVSTMATLKALLAARDERDSIQPSA